MLDGPRDDTVWPIHFVVVQVVTGADELDQEAAGSQLEEAVTVSKDVHEGTRGA